MGKSRAITSEDIKATEGIPNLFLNKKFLGVLIYNDLEEAAKLELFKKTQNEQLFKNEIKTLMVAPLNAWDGEIQAMIGLLYLTSREKKTFSIKYVDTIRFVADMVSNAISFTVLKNNSNGDVYNMLGGPN